MTTHSRKALMEGKTQNSEVLMLGSLNGYQTHTVGGIDREGGREEGMEGYHMPIGQ